MVAKKEPLSTTSLNRIYRKKLEYLYARRSAIDTLIQSLEGYDRFRAIGSESELRTA